MTLFPPEVRTVTTATANTSSDAFRQLAGESFRALGVAHAFSTRRGGVSTGIFDSLNFGNPSDLPREQRDPPSNIDRNLEILLQIAGVSGREHKEIVQVYQVHGAKAHVVRAGSPAHPDSPDPVTGESRDTKADAIVTDDPARVLCVRTADCTPILLASRDGRVVGAVHAGWRGVIAGVAPAALEAMRSLGAVDIHAVIGPCISRSHFEVGPEVVRAFADAFGAESPCRLADATDPHGKGFVDLQAALRIQLSGAGVRAIETIDLCTVARPDLFFSHRRDNGRTGRMAAIIAPRGHTR
ncbi:MAG: peptidoglycan editing factor PgeF [Phycisphaerales bacterium]|nr:peptidoglycan editing factor PgeF [Phycisphaerales bacterium]